MAEFRLTRGQLGAPEPRLPLLSTSAKHRVVISWFRRAQLIEFEDALFRTDSAVVLPAAEVPSAEGGPGRRRTAVGIAATCLRHAQEFLGRKLRVRRRIPQVDLTACRFSRRRSSSTTARSTSSRGASRSTARTRRCRPARYPGSRPSLIQSRIVAAVTPAYSAASSVER